MNEFKSCCFTGYRPHKFGFPFEADVAEYIKLENKLVDAVFSLPKENCFTFYCGMAMGFDILAGEIVALLKNTYNDAKIELVAVIPFEKQSENFPPEWKNRYDKLLKKTDRIVYVSKEYYKGCFNKRNKYMVDNSDFVITWFDGQGGGTASTLAYAHRNGKRIVNLAENGVHSYETYSPFEIIEEE